MVIERKSELLKVFTKHLDVLLKVINIGFSSCSLVVDKDLKLYICDLLRHLIQVMSDKGKELSSIGSTKCYLDSNSKFRILSPSITTY